MQLIGASVLTAAASAYAESDRLLARSPGFRLHLTSKQRKYTTSKETPEESHLPLELSLWISAIDSFRDTQS